jgi:hypothetical protein
MGLTQPLTANETECPYLEYQRQASLHLYTLIQVLMFQLRLAACRTINCDKIKSLKIIATKRLVNTYVVCLFGAEARSIGVTASIITVNGCSEKYFGKNKSTSLRKTIAFENDEPCQMSTPL